MITRCGDTAIVKCLDGTCAISRPSLATGRIGMMLMEVDYEKVTQFILDRLNGYPTKLIQDEFPELSAEQREFLMTGITPAEWLAMFPPEKEAE